jgi:hypothetical protein
VRSGTRAGGEFDDPERGAGRDFQLTLSTDRGADVQRGEDRVDVYCTVKDRIEYKNKPDPGCTYFCPKAGRTVHNKSDLGMQHPGTL